MNKKIAAAVAAAVLLIIGVVIIAGIGSRSRPGQITVQEQEPEYSLQIVEETGHPATRSAEELPVLTTAEETTATEQSELTAADEGSVGHIPTAKKKKNKNKNKTTTTVTTDYIAATETLAETEPLTVDVTIDKDGVYTTKDDVALYIYTYGELPSNFITKKEAQALGWKGGSLEPYAPGCCIGGSHFGNFEGKLPEKKGREYTECDIDTLGKKSRGAKRIVFSNDGLIYYTGDHYETFELLYGEE